MVPPCCAPAVALGRVPPEGDSLKNALWILLFVPALVACEEAKPAATPSGPTPPKPGPQAANDKPKPPGEPDHIKVQHILVGFKGSGVQDKPGQPAPTRPMDEARELAQRILELARTGVSMDELQQKYGTDDSKPGIYAMSNFGVPAKSGGYTRGGMVAAFGDVGFKLAVGDVGMSDYDKTTSPYGWHIIRRLE
jgi:hypothetical protein